MIRSRTPSRPAPPSSEPGLALPKPSRRERLDGLKAGWKKKAEDTARLRTQAQVRDRGCALRPLGLCAGGRREALHMDHFWGRGKEPQAISNVLMLCVTDDGRKTENKPTRLWWLETFRLHVIRYQYAEEIEKVERAIALEKAQHPETPDGFP